MGMRDLLLLAFIAATLVAAIRFPFAGVLLWAWFTLATPQQAAYGADQYPLNLYIAAATFIAMGLHGEFLKWRFNYFAIAVLAFIGWLFVSQWYSLDPERSEVPFDRFWKAMLFIFICAITVTDRLRFHALLWIIILIMGFFGAKGGMYTLLTLGQNTYFGLWDTILYDNNHMGIALAATLPLFIYMALRSNHWMVRWGIWLVFGLSLIAIIGTNSRGAFLTLIAFSGLMWLRSNKKIIGGIALALVGGIALTQVPDDWSERMSTITEAEEDDSFMGRVYAWEINWLLARENPLTGAGLRVPYDPDIAAEVSDKKARAAHSIYFEVLGGTGFVGLAIYGSFFIYGLWMAWMAERRYRTPRATEWRADFGKYGGMSIMVFCVGAASVSMEMWEGYLVVLALISSMHLMREHQPELDPPALTPRERVKMLLPAGARI